MIDFHNPTFEDKEQYQHMRRQEATKGCEFSYNNLYMWGNQQIAFLHGCAVIRSDYDGFRLYPCPVGNGDRKAAVEAIIQDAKERGLPFRLSGIDEKDQNELEQLFPGKFLFDVYRDGADYVYAIDDLADMKGRKMQKKRNHVNKFLTQHPNYQILPVTEEMLPQVKKFVDQWYEDRLREDPERDYNMEKTALERAFARFRDMEAEGLVLMEDAEILAFTMGSRMYADTFDTHFEKAKENVDGAYAMINREFARYLRKKYPELQFIDREDDMGLEGLRKAKLSYNPHHLVEKRIACLAEEGWQDED